MKKCDPIVIPKGIRFINEWEGYRLEDYPFPHILNKVLTGCGYTEYCLRNNQPLVLISPRIFLIENKEDQHPGEVFRVQNEIDRFHLVMDMVNHLPQLGNRGAYLLQKMRDTLVEHNQYIAAYGLDLPQVREWKWEN